MREAYRKNKLILIDELKDKNSGIELMIIYTGKEIPDYQHTEEKIIKLLKRFKWQE